MVSAALGPGSSSLNVNFSKRPRARASGLFSLNALCKFIQYFSELIYKAEQVSFSYGTRRM